MIEILTEFTSGGSKRGFSHYSQADRCGKAARLNAAKDEQNGTECCAAKAELGKPCPSHTGTLFHEMADVYHTKGNPELVFELTDVNLGLSVQEATRLFREYTNRFSPDAFGEPVACELQVPANDSEKQVLQDILGVELTARIDMVVRMSVDDCANWNPILRDEADDPLEPGIYLVDHKTRSQKPRDLAELRREYQLSPQFAGYQMVWDILHPDEPCQGMIANVIVRHKTLKDESFAQVLVDPPTQVERNALVAWLGRAEKKFNEGEVSLAACQGKYGACGWYLSGQCSRGAME